MSGFQDDESLVSGPGSAERVETDASPPSVPGGHATPATRSTAQSSVPPSSQYRARTGGSPLLALVYGAAAAAAGSGIDFLVVALTGRRVTLLALFIGLIVGFGVRAGAKFSSHLGYRLLAAALCYSAIVAGYVHQVLVDTELPDGIIGVMMAFVLSFAVPPVMLFEGELLPVVVVGLATFGAWSLGAAPSELAGWGPTRRKLTPQEQEANRDYASLVAHALLAARSKPGDSQRSSALDTLDPIEPPEKSSTRRSTPDAESSAGAESGPNPGDQQFGEGASEDDVPSKESDPSASA